MSFRATIDDGENKILWCKCLHVLSSFSEEIIFVITPTRLLVIGRNSGDTTQLDVQFSTNFFKEYEFTSLEGLTSIQGEVRYALSVRSKLLAMVFKKHEDEVDKFKLSFDATESCPMNLKYRLQIEITTKSSILKKFTPYYVPIGADLSNLAVVYKEGFHEKKTNYLMLGNGMLRNFLETAGSGTEHLKMEVNIQKFSLTAFTRGVYVKEKEILKQPMAVNMQFRSEDLHALEIGDDTNHSVILRLKDFKNFLTLGGHGEVVECYFKTPGSPILFEMMKNNVVVQLVQDTDGENHINTDQRTKIQKRIHHPPQNQQLRRETTTTQVRTQSRERSETPHTEEEEPEPLFVAPDGDGPKQNEFPPTPQLEDTEQRITWGDPTTENLTLKKLISTRKQVIEDAKSEYLKNLKKRKTDVPAEEEEEEALGPTQDVRRVKGLFD